MSDGTDRRAEHPRLNLFGMILLVAGLAVGVRWLFRHGGGPAYLVGCYVGAIGPLIGRHLERKRVDALMLLTAAAAPVTAPILLAITLLEAGRALLARLRKRPDGAS